MDEAGKNRAIIAHITLIGWIIALVQNNENNKSEFASFYIRQMLGLLILSVAVWIAGMIFMFIPVLGFILYIVLWLGLVGLWVMSLIGATNGKKEPTIFIGQYFQMWFKSL